MRAEAFEALIGYALDNPDNPEIWEAALAAAEEQAGLLARIRAAMDAAFPDGPPPARIGVLRAAAEEDLSIREALLYDILRDAPDCSPYAEAQLGDVCLLRGNPEAARHFFQRAARAAPAHAPAWRGLARSLMAAGSASAAVDPWTQYIELRPEDPDALYQLAWALIAHRGRPRDARPYLERAVRLDPDNVAILLGRGTAALLEDRPDVDTAAASFQRALEIAPGDPDVHYNLGVLYADHAGDGARAIHHFERFIELDGDASGRVKQWIEELRLADPAGRGRKR